MPYRPGETRSHYSAAARTGACAARPAACPATCPAASHAVRSLWLGAAALALALAAQPHPALSAEATSHSAATPSRAAELAQAAEAKHFDIAAQPLAGALTRFRKQSGLQLAYRTEEIRDLQSPGASGTMLPEEALRRLLAGTGLVFEFTGTRTVTLAKVDATGAQQMAPITVEGKAPPRQSEIGNLMPAYPGGQVARGGKLGILGNKDVMDTPFNQTSYTSKLLKNQQSKFISDAVQNDPSVVRDAAPSSGLDNFIIRGFSTSNADILLNGMPGVAASFFNSSMSESFERVEVLKGPNALLNGIAPSESLGGTVNLMPKRAGDEPLTQANLDYTSETHVGGHVDIGRRFGANDEFGVRFNGVWRDGNMPVDNQSREQRLAAFGLDYRGDRFRLEMDLGYQYQDVQGTRRFSGVQTGVVVPDVPDSRTNFYDPWEFTTPEVHYGAVRAEFDITPDFTAFAALGGHERSHKNSGTNRQIVNGQGDLAAGNAQRRVDRQVGQAVEAGIRGNSIPVRSIINRSSPIRGFSGNGRTSGTSHLSWLPISTIPPTRLLRLSLRCRIPMMPRRSRTSI